jgi:hypothetical protein
MADAGTVPVANSRECMRVKLWHYVITYIFKNARTTRRPGKYQSRCRSSVQRYHDATVRPLARQQYVHVGTDVAGCRIYRLAGQSEKQCPRSRHFRDESRPPVHPALSGDAMRCVAAVQPWLLSACDASKRPAGAAAAAAAAATRNACCGGGGGHIHHMHGLQMTTVRRIMQ